MSLDGNVENCIELHGSLSIPDTIRGKSAYEIAVYHGFEGTEEEWIAHLETAQSEALKESAEQAQADIENDRQTALSDIEGNRQTALSDIEGNRQTALSDIAEAKATMLEEIELAAEIVQTPGNSETAVMSQKATTDAINQLSDELFGGILKACYDTKTLYYSGDVYCTEKLLNADSSQIGKNLDDIVQSGAEGGWKYVFVDISGFSKITLPAFVSTTGNGSLIVDINNVVTKTIYEISGDNVHNVTVDLDDTDSKLVLALKGSQPLLVSENVFVTLTNTIDDKSVIGEILIGISENGSQLESLSKTLKTSSDVNIVRSNQARGSEGVRYIIDRALDFWEHREEFIYCSGTALDTPWDYWSTEGRYDINTGGTITKENAGYKCIDCSTFARYCLNGIGYYSSPYYNLLENTDIVHGALTNGVETVSDNTLICRTDKMYVRPNKPLIKETKSASYVFNGVYGYNANDELVETYTDNEFIPNPNVVYIRAEMTVTNVDEYSSGTLFKYLRIRENETPKFSANIPLAKREANQMCEWLDDNGYGVLINQHIYSASDIEIGAPIFWGRNSSTRYKHITHVSFNLGSKYLMHVYPNGLQHGKAITISTHDELIETYDMLSAVCNTSLNT